VKRWLLLEENPALLRPDWMPPPEDWPEFADDRAEHVRLLAVRQQAWDEACALSARFQAEDEVRAQAVKTALVEGREPDEPETTPPAQREDERREALLKWEQATDLFVEFLERLCAEIRQRGPELYAALEAENGDAEKMRQEALRLLAQADRQAGEGVRKRGWLDRGTGRSFGGYVPFAALGVPEPPEPIDFEAVLAGGSVTEVSHA
jgi:hypothetical protein